MGRRHLDAYLKAAGARPVAAVCRTPETLARLEEDYGARGLMVTTDLAGALARARPHLVSVCSPTPLHATHARAALAAGAHVLVEKPLTATLAEGRALLRAARTAERTLMSAHTTLFEPACALLGRLVLRGALGTIERLRFARRGADLSPGEIDRGRLGGQSLEEEPPLRDDPRFGWLYDHLIHVTCLINHLTGSVPAEVAVAERAQSPTRQTLRAAVVYGSGARAEIVLSSLPSDSFAKELHVSGSAGEAEWILAGGRARLRVRLQGSGTWRELPLPATSAFDAVVFHFVEAVRAERPPLVSGADGLRAMALAASLAGGFPA